MSCFKHVLWIRCCKRHKGAMVKHVRLSREFAKTHSRQVRQSVAFSGNFELTRLRIVPCRLLSTQILWACLCCCLICIIHFINLVLQQHGQHLKINCSELLPPPHTHHQKKCSCWFSSSILIYSGHGGACQTAGIWRSDFSQSAAFAESLQPGVCVYKYVNFCVNSLCWGMKASCVCVCSANELSMQIISMWVCCQNRTQWKPNF